MKAESCNACGSRDVEVIKQKDRGVKIIICKKCGSFREVPKGLWEVWF